jgi:hypothetical protein
MSQKKQIEKLGDLEIVNQRLADALLIVEVGRLGTAMNCALLRVFCAVST